MTTLSPVSLAHLDTLELPASPASILDTATLAELEQIRTGWIEKARTEQIPEKLFEIAYWLGETVDTLWGGTHRRLILDDLRISIGVTIVDRNITKSAWNYRRTLSIYLGESFLMLWRWYYVAQNIDDVMSGDAKTDPSELPYIPGEWVTRALALAPKAEKTKISISQASTDIERNELAGRLLVGKTV